MTPYYDEGGITIYHGDCRDLLPDLRADLVLTDPPYGVNERTARGAAGRTCLGLSRDFPAVYGDDAPFDPAPCLTFPRVVLFGANHYADRLPPSPSWIVWDKLDGLTGKRTIGFNDNADAEMAWSNLGGPARLIRHRWMGLLRATESGEPTVHPTQKPVWLMAAILRWRRA